MQAHELTSSHLSRESKLPHSLASRRGCNTISQRSLKRTMATLQRKASKSDDVVGVSGSLLERANGIQNAVRKERERVHGNGATSTFLFGSVTLEVDNLGPTIGSVVKGVKMGEVAKDANLLAAVKELLNLRKVIFFVSCRKRGREITP